MVAERLNGLALLHVHKDIIVNIDKVIHLCNEKSKIKILLNQHFDKWQFKMHLGYYKQRH